MLAAGNTLSQGYDRVGNVISEGRSFSGISGDSGSGTNTLSYDPLRRLTAETGLSSSRGYTYDLDGNRTRKVEGGTTIDYTYDRTDQLINQTISGVGTAFSYDVYGNLTQSGNSVSAVTTYTLDTASHLTAINAPGTTADVALTLDALGRFATRTVNGATDTYGYLGASETVLAIVGATTRLSALAADGSRLATKDGSTTGYLLPDLHGNVVAAEASGSTTISTALRYDGYGQTLGAYSGSGSIAMDAKYQGRLDLSATSDPLYDMSARFYSPGLGAFTQLDTVAGTAQDPLSMNRFLYAAANPTTLIDPTGHKACYYDPCGSGPYELSRPNGTTKLVEPPTPTPTTKPKPDDTDDSSTAGGATSPVWTPNPGKVADDRIWLPPTAAPSLPCSPEFESSVQPGCVEGGGDRHDGLGWFVVGAGEGLVAVGVGVVETPLYALTHLSDAAVGLQCFQLDGCLARAVHETGFDHAPENFLRGVQYVHDQPDEYKGQFFATVGATGALLGRGFGGLAKSARCPTCGGVVDTPGLVPDASIVLRGGTSEMPGPGQAFSGAAAPTLEEAARSLSYGKIRTTTAGEIRAGGGTVQWAPELTRGGNLNTFHVNICLGTGACPFGPTIDNPILKALRLQ